jgi:hypothetical protein
MPKVAAAQSIKRDDADFGVVLHRIDVDTGAVLRSFELPSGNTKFGRYGDWFWRQIQMFH